MIALDCGNVSCIVYTNQVSGDEQMMLHELNVGEEAVIDAINVSSSLKSRLGSLGLCENQPICVKHYGFFRSTVQVMTESSFIALRKDEACCIEVHKIV
jgi:Fe2+ transport system protein FeoA